jgi:acyl carrier protein
LNTSVLQVLRDVRIVIAEQLGIDVEAIPPDIKFGDIGADSLDTVEIMMSLEEKFELTLDEEGTHFRLVRL